MSDSGYLKCSCSYCQGHIEFPAHAVGITTTCPHCGVETTLIDPVGASGAPPPPPPPPRPPSLAIAPKPPPLSSAVPAAAGTPPPVSASMTPMSAAATGGKLKNTLSEVGSVLVAATDIAPVPATSTGGKLKKILNVVWSVLAGLAVLAYVGLKVWRGYRRTERVVEAVKGEPKPEKPKPTSESPKPVPMPTPAAPATSVVVAKGAPPERKPGEDLQVLNFEVQKAKDGNLQYVIGVVTNHAARQYFNVKLEFELTRKDGKAGDLAADSIRNLAPNAGVIFKASIIGNAPVASAKLAKLEGEKE